MDAVHLEIFRHRCTAIAEEMGAALERSALSANIQERRDYSCAIFDRHGHMVAQAAHIPVHLGAMPRSVAAAIDQCAPLLPGDVVLLNDPFAGGTHLPDFTSVAPVYVGNELVAYSATRAHHADVGGITPGSMPMSTSIYQEGIIIPPVRLVAGGVFNHALIDLITRNSRTSDERRGDLAAQLACHRIAEARIQEYIARYQQHTWDDHCQALIDYGERQMRALIASIPPGTYVGREYLDNDGQTDAPIDIVVTLTVASDHIHIDFSGTALQTAGPLNAPQAVTESAVLYALRLLAGDDMPASAGLYRPLHWHIPHGSLLNPLPPAAVAGGNVETSQRVVDAVLQALAQAIPDRIPAQSAGTMNNWTMGGVRSDGTPFAYYETLGGGMGARPRAPGLSAVQTHMTNTRNTPVEAFERLYPVRVETLAIRSGSGGGGMHRGGDGLYKAVRFLVPATVTVLSERRVFAPQGHLGGAPGACGINLLEQHGVCVDIGGKGTHAVQNGDVLHLYTPAGGGYGHL
jgi:N-methylhydantoinase B